MTASTRSVLSILTILSFSSHLSHAMIPTAELHVHVDGTAPTLSVYKLFASQASFGVAPPMLGTNKPSAPSLPLALPPTENSNLCTKPTDKVGSQSGTIMLVPRGSCTFETKAYHAQLLGAKAIMIYGALESRYMANSTSTTHTEHDIVWPVPLHDYDCDKGRAEIPKGALDLQNPFPYNPSHNNPLLSGETSQNMCIQKSPNQLDFCPSKACLLTGKVTDDGQSYEACCAWDLYIWLFYDPTFHSANTSADMQVQIPAVYVTLKQGLKLLHDYSAGNAIQIQVYERWRPQYNVSSALIWALAVIVAAVAAHLSAGDYHAKRDQVLRSKSRQRGDRPREGRRARPSNEQSQQHQQQQPEESLELNAWHAVVFLVMASTSLLVLFYFKIYAVVKVMYAFGCSKATSVVLLTPLISRAMRQLGIPNRRLFRIEFEEIGDVTIVDTVAHIIGYTLGLTWLVLAFSYYHPETITYFWVMQDVFGACMCVLFLQVIKLNNIRVATFLLVIAFFYDIFFVFISPLIFKKSVMIDVATSGGPPPNPEWCEKYPDDPENCQQRGNPLPMLFTIPRIADYQGGQNLLGLGDIVVPGLLISFAARFDAAKSLLGVMGGGNGSLGSYACPERRFCGSLCCNGGYFVPVVIAYGIGLLMANAAVYLMEMGQPALLYLVPCCLGMFLVIGWRRNELAELWEGPRAIRTADIVCYGEDTIDASHAPLPQQEDGSEMEAISVPSARDEFRDEPDPLSVSSGH